MRPKKCKACGAKIAKPFSSTQKACSWQCALKIVEQEKEKKSKREDRLTREKLKTLSEYLADAQTEFNAFIRARDKGKPCISCQRHHRGRIHAGHFRSVGAAPHLRFHEDNAHGQCGPCNTHLSGNSIEYRINLVKLIGVDRVEALEQNNTPAKYTVEDAKRIKKEYREKRKSLEALSL